MSNTKNLPSGTAEKAVDDVDTVAPLVTPVVRGLRLLRYIAQGGSTSNLSEVGRLIDVNRVTVMRLLSTLEHEGMIVRLPQGGHQIGLGFLTMAAASLASHDLMGAGRRVINQLCQALGASAYLVLPEGDDIVYALREMPESGLVSNIKVGSRVPAYLTAPGRCMLAALSGEELHRRLQSAALSSAKGNKPVIIEQLRDQIADARKSGCAWSFSGYEAGINACAAAVHDINGQAVAALSVVGPESLFSQDETFAQRVESAVKKAAADLSCMLGASGTA